MRKIRSTILTFALALGLVAPALVPVAAYADNCTGSAVECAQQGVKNAGGDQNTKSLQDYIKIIVNVMLFILGAIAVIMIIIGGIRYTTSNGDASATKSAKDTVLYAVIGLIVAILAYAIVNFVIGVFGAK